MKVTLSLCPSLTLCFIPNFEKCSCKVSTIQSSEGTRKENPKLRANLLWRPIYMRKTSLVPSFFSLCTLAILTLCFCHQFQQNWGPVPLSWVILWISLIYTVLIHLCNPKKFEEAKILNFATFAWVSSSTTSKSHLKLPSMVGANQWINWGSHVKDLHFVFWNLL